VLARNSKTIEMCGDALVMTTKQRQPDVRTPHEPRALMAQQNRLVGML
jgi:hypothetical protein